MQRRPGMPAQRRSLLSTALPSKSLLVPNGSNFRVRISIGQWDVGEPPKVRQTEPRCLGFPQPGMGAGAPPSDPLGRPRKRNRVDKETRNWELRLWEPRTPLHLASGVRWSSGERVSEGGGGAWALGLWLGRGHQLPEEAERAGHRDRYAQHVQALPSSSLFSSFFMRKKPNKQKNNLEMEWFTH